MKTILTLGIVLCAAGTSLSLAAEAKERPLEFHAELSKYVTERIAEFDQISPERKKTLQALTDYVKLHRDAKRPIRLTFICTHNSRRSHMSQLWAAVAAQHYGVERVETFSGGTEETAFNPRAVAAMRRAGFVIDKPEEPKNPRYQVTLAKGTKREVCFSKVYHQKPNPTKDYCAVMTCTQADKACPTAPGAAARLSIPFEDPKVADNTPGESSKYDERCAQIAREMLYVFSQVK